MNTFTHQKCLLKIGCLFWIRSTLSVKRSSFININSYLPIKNCISSIALFSKRFVKKRNIISINSRLQPIFPLENTSLKFWFHVFFFTLATANEFRTYTKSFSSYYYFYTSQNWYEHFLKANRRNHNGSSRYYYWKYS